MCIRDRFCIFLERGEAVLPHRVLHLTDGERIEQVIFAALAVLILAAHDQLGFRIRERLEGVGMLHLRFASKHAEADALDARRGAGEVGLNKRFVQAHCFEDLRATITLQSTDAVSYTHLDVYKRQAMCWRKIGRAHV